MKRKILYIVYYTHFFFLLISPSLQLATSVRSQLVRDVSTQNVDITSISRNPSTSQSSKMKLSFSNSGVPWFRVSRLDTSTNNISGVTFRLAILGIIEYSESPIGQNGFDATDFVVSQISLVSNITLFKPIEESSNTKDDVTFYAYEVESLQAALDCNRQVVPLFSMWIGISDLRGYIRAINRTLAPNSYKWQLDIRGFPYKANNTRLAVKMAVEAASDFDILSEAPSTEKYDTTVPMSCTQTRSADGDEDIGYFTWENAVNATQCTSGSCVVKQIPVVHTNLIPPEKDFVLFPDVYSTVLDSPQNGRISTESRNFIYFSFPVDNPCSLQWDPIVGIDEPVAAAPIISFAVRWQVSWKLLLTSIYFLLVMNK